MSRQDFNGRPFVAGSLIGVRAFKVDTDATLTGVVHETRFLDGENLGECLQTPWMRVMGGMASTLFIHHLTGMPLQPSEHRVGTQGCTCGYYAYFRGRNNWAQDGTIVGLIEGYGVCTVGDRGFRAEKARLVALVVPHRKRFARTRRGWASYKAGVNAVVRPAIHGNLHRVLSRAAKFPPTRKASDWLNARCDRTASWVQWFLGWALALSTIWIDYPPLHAAVWVAGTSMWAAAFNKGGKPAKVPAISGAEFAAVRQHYRGVPVYRTRREAVRAHPLTQPDRKHRHAS